jgi:hypothetical protein
LTEEDIKKEKVAIKYSAEFLDSARRKKQKEQIDEDIEAEKLMDEHANKIGLRRLI